MPPDDSLEIDIALPPIDPQALYDEAEVDLEEVPRAPLASSFGRAIGLLGVGVGWGVRALGPSLLVALLLVAALEFAARSIEPRLAGRIYDPWTTAGHPISTVPNGSTNSALVVMSRRLEQQDLGKQGAADDHAMRSFRRQDASDAP